MDIFESPFAQATLVTVGLFVSYHAMRFGYKLVFSSDNTKELAFLLLVEEWIGENLPLVWLLTIALLFL